MDRSIFLTEPIKLLTNMNLVGGVYDVFSDFMQQ